VSGVLPGSSISPFVAEWLPRVAAAIGVNGRPRRALDLAMGEGRHAVPLALAGFQTFGVDRSVERLATACGVARGQRLAFHAWAADLDTYPLPAECFDLLFCTRFLLRARWDDLKGAVTPGGFVMYETFTIHQVRIGRGPSSPDHLLRPGELAAAFADWDILFSEEAAAPAAMARLVARKPDAADHPATEQGRRS
jgi:tellurite methyltransferase